MQCLIKCVLMADSAPMSSHYRALLTQPQVTPLLSNWLICIIHTVCTKWQNLKVYEALWFDQVNLSLYLYQFLACFSFFLLSVIYCAFFLTQYKTFYGRFITRLLILYMNSKEIDILCVLRKMQVMFPFCLLKVSYIFVILNSVWSLWVLWVHSLMTSPSVRTCGFEERGLFTAKCAAIQIAQWCSFCHFNNISTFLW